MEIKSKFIKETDEDYILLIPVESVLEYIIDNLQMEVEVVKIK